jgi:hypothetical protein
MNKRIVLTKKKSSGISQDFKDIKKRERENSDTSSGETSSGYGSVTDQFAGNLVVSYGI